MRVVSGIAGGLRLKAPPGRLIRPATERLREAVFASLGSSGDLDGALVLDLFAGTGAMGIEALSRGAAAATFVERDASVARLIEANLATTGLAGGAVVRSDALRFLEANGAVFDVAFVDPPYDFSAWDEVLERLPAGLAVLESPRLLGLPHGWEAVRSRRYGGSVVTFARPE